MIKLEHIKKTYNAKKQNELKVCNDTSLELPNIGLISFLGASGSGKTTLLNIIGGLDKADSGSITYDDLTFNKYNMRNIDKYRSKNIGYVFQNYNLLNDRTVYENLRIALEIIGVTDEEEVSKRIEYTLKAVGLFKFRKKLASALSGGQQQRVSIARCLIKNSKVIIADEPTGNLDSENSLEIMNILKKISEKTLVLMVTHDQNLAYAYSDKIVTIKDGVVTDVIKLDSNQKLKNNTDNKIYLKDLNEIKEGNVVKTNYFHENEEETLELTIIEKNGVFYIEGNKNIKLLKDSPIRLIDAHYEEEIKVDIKDFEYDTTWYNDSLKTNKTKSFIRDFFSEVKSFFFTRKKTKFFHLVFILLGVIIGVINILFINLTYIDTSEYDSEHNALISTSDLSDSNYDSLVEAKDKGLIESVDEYRRTSLYFSYGATSFSSYSYDYYTNLYSDSYLEGYSLLEGKNSTSEKEIVIGKELADDLCKKFGGVSYKMLIGIRDTYSSFEIVGISSKSTNQVYFNNNIEYNERIYSSSGINSHSYGIYKYEKELYEIVEGEDLDGKTNSVILDYDTFGNNELGGSYGSAAGYRPEATIVGFFRAKSGFKVDSLDIYSDDYIEKATVDSNINLYSIDYADKYIIVDGVEPTNKNEIIVNAYNSHNVGDKITHSNIEYTIVGKYKWEQVTTSYCDIAYTNSDTLDYIKLRELTEGHSISIEVSKNNLSEFKQFAQSHDMSFSSHYDISYSEEKEDIKDGRLIITPIIAVLIVAVVVYIYFSMRSKMISDIYDIGVYRALGTSRLELIGKQLTSIFVLSTFTSFIGYVLFNAIYGFIASNINKLGGGMTGVLNHGSTYLIGVILYLVSLIFGIIPIICLTRKTPSEIISKYDI